MSYLASIGERTDPVFRELDRLIAEEVHAEAAAGRRDETGRHKGGRKRVQAEHCIAAGCHGRPRARGLCNIHYQRWYAHER